MLFKSPAYYHIWSLHNAMMVKCVVSTFLTLFTDPSLLWYLVPAQWQCYDRSWHCSQTPAYYEAWSMHSSVTGPDVVHTPQPIMMPSPCTMLWQVLTLFTDPSPLWCLVLAQCYDRSWCLQTPAYYDVWSLHSAMTGPDVVHRSQPVMMPGPCTMLWWKDLWCPPARPC